VLTTKLVTLLLDAKADVAYGGWTKRIAALKPKLRHRNLSACLDKGGAVWQHQIR